jgi:peptidoglycan/LPS O-acetylase OafA/YrhL
MIQLIVSAIWLIANIVALLGLWLIAAQGPSQDGTLGLIIIVAVFVVSATTWGLTRASWKQRARDTLYVVGAWFGAFAANTVVGVLTAGSDADRNGAATMIATAGVLVALLIWASRKHKANVDNGSSVDL